jgi:hypothetical protein
MLMMMFLERTSRPSAARPVPSNYNGSNLDFVAVSDPCASHLAVPTDVLRAICHDASESATRFLCFCSS